MNIYNHYQKQRLSICSTYNLATYLHNIDVNCEQLCNCSQGNKQITGSDLLNAV